ncbi:hypothetical protein D9758_003590 [Tetrapyrgos nigripes]|uniref:Uncharacterized protein n=1 Tax=Tetrapyrgos nigripes TaxID=182062 RepID=A0A8H5GV19_9AGAR|nr:hypothetical protein D9758_003590 [Tetrapyrgos nigripes]
MAPQPDSATPTAIYSVKNPALIGQKLRVAGRMMSYSDENGFIILEHKNAAVLVDVSLIIGPKSAWVNETYTTIMVAGYLDKSEDALPLPELPPYATAPDIDPHLVLNAILAVPVVDLDMDLWHGAIEELGKKISSD